MKLINLFAALLFLLGASEASGQDAFPVRNLSLTVITEGSTMNVTAHLEVSDTTEGASIVLKLGVRPTLSDILSDEFSLASQASASSGKSFTRQGNQVTIKLGNLPIQSEIYFESYLNYTGVNPLTGTSLSLVTAGHYHQ